MIFASDNWAGASDKVLASVQAAAAKGGPAYGGDRLTAAVEARFADIFEREVAVFFVGTGTAANALSMTAFRRPGGYAFCHRLAHVTADEPGATEFFAGLRLVGLAGEGARIAPEAFRDALAAPANPHFGGPVAVTLSQLTELGTVYRLEEVATIAGLAHERGLGVHMDGARFATAVAALGVSPAEATWRAGVDVISFGGTKAGCIAAEAVVFFDKGLARDFAAMRQMAGHTFSKSWFVAAQFAAYLEDGHWLALAGHANAMAARLAGHIRTTDRDARLALAPDANQVFAILSEAADRRLKAAGAVYHPWSTAALPDGIRLAPGESFVRLVASFQTTAAEVDRFGEVLAGA